MRRLVGCVLTVVLAGAAPLHGAETLWVEAEHLEGIKGFCWPEMKKTNGHWGLSVAS
jgi:hypothetical protein